MTGQAQDPFRLDGSVAVVTGASSGLGVAIARRLANAGAALAIGARRVDRLADVAESIAADSDVAVHTHELDVADESSCDDFVSSTVDRLGRIDVLVNNAGVGVAVPATRDTADGVRHLLDVNLVGAYSMARASAPFMRAGSSIVNISSVLASTSFFGTPQAGYCASKAGIEALTRDLAQQWTGRKGIRVNAVAPGLFPTEMSAEYPDDFLQRLTRERIPSGRLGDLDECALAVLFLASTAASYVTGVVLPVDGGLLSV